MPGMLGQRLFSVMDQDQDGFLNKNEFVGGMISLYHGEFNYKMMFVFNM